MPASCKAAAEGRSFPAPARLVAARLALAADGDRVALAVRRQRQLDRLALTLLVHVGDELRVGVLLRTDGQVAVQLIDCLNVRHSPQRPNHARMAALARAVG